MSGELLTSARGRSCRALFTLVQTLVPREYCTRRRTGVSRPSLAASTIRGLREPSPQSRVGVLAKWPGASSAYGDPTVPACDHLHDGLVKRRQRNITTTIRITTSRITTAIATFAAVPELEPA